MRRSAVTIGELRDHLSAFLRDVRRGREVIVLDRETPFARIVAYEAPKDLGAELSALVAEGLVRAPDTMERAEPGAPRAKSSPRAKRRTKVRDNALLEALLANREDSR